MTDTTTTTSFTMALFVISSPRTGMICYKIDRCTLVPGSYVAFD